MTCKYYDCGWCYSPENVETNAVQGGCFEPERCPYITNNRKMLDEKGHLECEIAELQLEIEQKVKAIGNLKDILERRQQRLKQMNHRTPYKPEVQYYDEQMVIVNGVQYQRVELPKQKHLQQIIQECFDDKKNIHTTSDIIERIEKEWTPLNLNQKENRGFTDGYSMGFDVALGLVRKTLR
jgi:hypothetical protein